MRALILVISFFVFLDITWTGERHYTFSDDRSWEVISGNWEIKKGEYHNTEVAEEAIVLLKRDE